MLYRRKLHFNVHNHVNTPQVLVTWKQKKNLETGSDLCFVERLMSAHLPDPDLLPHCPMKTEEIPNELFKALIYPGFRGQLRRQQLPWGSTGVTTGLGSPETFAHFQFHCLKCCLAVHPFSVSFTFPEKNELSKTTNTRLLEANLLTVLFTKQKSGESLI